MFMQDAVTTIFAMYLLDFQQVHQVHVNQPSAQLQQPFALQRHDILVIQVGNEEIVTQICYPILYHSVRILYNNQLCSVTKIVTQICYAILHHSVRLLIT